ncbi:MAG: S41 family peptidase [Paludibacter sp.]|nr:S41 family peptidase [Paludibacter sp.]
MKKVFFCFFACLFVGSASIFSQINNKGFTINDEIKISNLMDAVSRYYVDTINGKQLVETAIVAILKDLDPHSVYVPKKEIERVHEPLEGSFDGIGIQFQMFEDTLLVVQTIAGCPAAKVGISPDDRIIYVENELIAGVKKQSTDIMKLLRGPRGTEVMVKVKRAGERDLLTFNITRDKIPLYSVDAKYMVTPEIGYIKINSFGSKTISEYKAAVDTLKKQGMTSLILSLQGNGGGYLDAAIELADQFLGNKRLVVYTEGLRQPRRDAFATEKGNFEKNELVILVDEFSASASEIVSGAVQDWDRGLIVGRRTFGKGLVQRELSLVDASMIRLTVARYYTPVGRCIQKPYKGSVNYEKDLLARFEHGEMQHADSIHFADSLKFTTLVNKRTVYGGGGIMPDVFVPLDTIAYTPYYRSLAGRGIVNRAYITYLQENREYLKELYPDFQSFKNNFEVPQSMLESMLARANELKIEFNQKEYEQSLPLLKTQLKALIAGDLWTTNEFYQIMDSTNDSLQKAVEILQKKGEYKRLLKY